jgi:type I restriction enzyme S subunit
MVMEKHVPEGYKKTEVGVIPVDWEVLSIDELTLDMQYAIVDGPFGSNLKKIHYKPSGIPILSSGFVTSGKFISDNYNYIDAEKFKKERRSAVKGGDILMAKIGERCGACALVPKEHPIGILSGNSLKISIDEEKYSKEYVVQALYNEFSIGHFEKIRASSGQPAISIKNLKKYSLALPSKRSEQKAIATALSDVDNLISSLEQLIEKKNAIKQGTMQELLTGRRRLKGFGEGKRYKQTELGLIPEDWEIKSFGDVLSVKHGKSQKEVEIENGKYPILATGGIIGWSNSYLANTPSVLIGRKGTIDKPQYMDTPFWTVDTLFYTEINPSNCAKYLYYIFKLIPWYSYNEASGVPSLNATTIEKIRKAFPSTKREQEVISEALTLIDSEIENLEAKVDKYKQIKQGMMQNLLTGRIRLV